MKNFGRHILYAPDDGGGASGAQDGGTDKGAEGVDLSNPAVQAAIQAAIKQETARRDEAEKGLVAKKDELLAELAGYKKLGKAEELAKRIRDAEVDAAAGKAGVPSEKLLAEAERLAQQKHDATVLEWSAVNKSKDEEIATLKSEVERLTKAENRSYLLAQLYQAAIPPEMTIVNPGTEDYILDTIEPLVVRQRVDGLPYEVPRLKINGALLPTTKAKGGNPDGLMDIRELLDLVRAQKPPAPHLARLGYFLASSARGTGGVTTTSTGNNGAGRNWWKMSATEQAKFISENGAGEARKLIDASGRKPREAAA